MLQPPIRTIAPVGCSDGLAYQTIYTFSLEDQTAL